MEPIKSQYVFLYSWGDADPVWIRDKDLLHQLIHVLRIQKGDSLALLDGNGSKLLVRVQDIQKKWIVCEKLGQEKKDRESPSWHLVLGTPKKEALKEILRYGTQLGVCSFILVDSEYSQVRSSQYEAKRESFMAIIKESLEQSGRFYLPVLKTYSSWELFRSQEEFSHHQVLVGDLWKETDQKRILLHDYEYQGYENIFLMVGPEGGWSPQERIQFQEWPGNFYNLSPYILRTQTAAIVSVVVAQTLLNSQNPKE